MSLRPRFSNSPAPPLGRSAASSGAGADTAANQHNATVKDHDHDHHYRFLISASRYRLSILFLILLTTLLYCFDLFTNHHLDHHDVLRGLLGVVHFQQTRTIRSALTRQEHPRMVHYYLLDGTVEIDKNQQRAEAAVVVVPRVSLASTIRNTSRGGIAAMTVEPMSTSSSELQDNTNDEREKDLGLADPLETRKCKAQYQWQLDSKPTCNSMHEMDLGYFLDKKNKHGDFNDDNVLRERVRLIAGGGWRDVWGLVDHYHRGDIIGHSDNAVADNNNRYVVLKTLLYRKDVVPRNVERHRRDAMAMERLTSSPNIVDIYAFCGNTGVFEYANGGDLELAVRTMAKSWLANGQLTREERLQRLQFGVQAAMGLADLHNFDMEGRPSIAHADISLGQFVKIDGRFKLNDFNRARFLLENRKTKEVCPYRIGNNPGRSRSPEEYKYTDQTEKVDVYSFGNILYTLLTLERPFNDISSEDAQELVIEGKRPKPTGHDGSIAVQLWTSNDPIDLALRSAMEMCLIYNVTERATARQVESFLKAQLEQIDPGRLEAWGVK